MHNQDATVSIAVDAVENFHASADTLRNSLDSVRYSPWLTVDQQMISDFAAVTRDQQFIHVDPVRAAASAFGGTIAHGFLTLSLLAHLHDTIATDTPKTGMLINYGLDRVRFVHPVRAGSRIRLATTLRSLTEKSAGQLQLTHESIVEIEGEAKPALVAHWLTLQVG